MIVFITGASSGIGEACAKAFAQHGANLILAARRYERLEALAAHLQKEHRITTHLLKLDVRDEEGVAQAVKTLPKEWKDIDVLVNNAGLSRGLEKLHEGSSSDWEEMIDTNVKGLLYVSRAVIPGMVARLSGHIITIGSVAGHEVYPGGAVYCASKFAADAITRGMRMDLVDTPLRVTTIDPGLVETEFSIVRFHGDVERAKKVYAGITPLSPADVADAVLYAATRPAHVQIGEIIMYATSQASATVVARK